MNNMLRRTKQINWEGLGKRMRTHGLSNYGPLGNNLCKAQSSAHGEPSIRHAAHTVVVM